MARFAYPASMRRLKGFTLMKKKGLLAFGED